jgi:parallel beta-helix repeat protein
MDTSQRRSPGWIGSTLRMLLLALLGFGAALPGRSALAAPNDTIVISPTSTSGWGFLQETANGSGNFAAGPAGSLGSGSARLVVDGTGGVFIGNVTTYRNTRLDALTSLSYTTYRTSGSGSVAPALQLGMDYDLTDTDVTFQGRLVFEPHTAGTVATGAWQIWSPLTAGKWFATRAPFNSLCAQATPCTWAQVQANWPNAGIHADSPHGWILLKAGGGWTGGFDGNVDALTIAVAGDSTTFDFEPEPACTSLCYVNGTTGNDANGGSSAADPKKTIQAALNQVQASGTVRVAAGTYNENVSIATSGVTLEGAGAGGDPALHTIINNAAPAVAGTPGIRLSNGVTGVKITQLRVQGFAASGIHAAGANNNFTADRVDLFNNAAGPGGGGLYMNGPVSTVVITGSNVQNNTARAIVIWNGFKQNITISNNVVKGNVCCGIELQDGTASGVTITGNTIEDNGDNGIGVVGLMAGAGPNLIANNTLRNNGRFGIEIKLPNGTGLESGDGSIVVRNNLVSRDTTPTDLRDLAGIAVFRRGWVAGNNNVDIPTGVIVRNNTVAGYRQPSDSDGFGIVVEGTNMRVHSNTVENSDVAIQRQAGNLPYTPNTNIDGDQANKVDLYFGRGNSPSVCAVVSNNSFTANTVNLRDVGPVNRVIAASAVVTNTTTGLGYCSIQGAIDDAATLAGHTISIGPGTFRENVIVNKSLTLVGAGRDATIIQPVLPSECRDSICGERIMVWTAAPIITVRDLTLDGDNPMITGTLTVNGADHDAEVGVAGIPSAHSLCGLTIDHVRIKNITSRGVVMPTGYPYTITNSLFENITSAGVIVEGAGLIDGNSFTLIRQTIIVNDGEVVISDNEIDSATMPASSGIKVFGSAAASIRNNIIRNVDHGILIERMNPGAPTAIISANAFLNTAVAGVVVNGTVSATLNWWGSATGPTTAANPGGTGAVVSAGVTFAPWLCSGADTSPATGFQPNLAPCGSSASLSATAGTPQSADVNTAFATSLQATVRDAANNPLAGVAVTFTAPAGGASGTFPGGQTTVTVLTNAAGVATAPAFTANGTAGSYAVTASVAGLATMASFALTNLAVVPPLHKIYLPILIKG